MGQAVVLLFSVACADPCGASALERQQLEREVVRVLVDRGLAVRPAAAEVPRPTGPSAPPDPIDVAAKLEVDRVVALDLEPGERALWVTHFLRGFPGAWAVHQMFCARTEEKGPLECP